LLWAATAGHMLSALTQKVREVPNVSVN